MAKVAAPPAKPAKKAKAPPKSRTPGEFEPVQTLLRSHYGFVEANRPSWSAHRDSYMDNFWRDQGDVGSRVLDVAEVSNIDTIPLFAVNRMKGWVVSYTASLFYRGFSAEVAPDEVYDDDTPVDPMGDLVKLLLDRWFTNAPFDTVTEAAFTSCLLNPHGAFYLKEDPRPRRPIDRITVEFMPVWECVWDRFSSSVEAARYMGRSWWVSFEEAQAMFPEITDEDLKQQATSKPDVLRSGLRSHADKMDADKSYVRILDISYPRAAYLVKAEGVEDTTVRGKRCVYLLTPYGDVSRLVREGPMQWQDADGLPILNVEPIVLTPVPEYPLWGIPNAGTIYALERENNSYAAWLAQAFKLEALRKLFIDRSKITDEGNEGAADPIDQTMVEVQPGALANGAGGVAAWMAQAPAPTSGLQLRQFVEQMFQAVQGTAPFTRGQPTPYIPATESANLSAYSETTLGLLRSKMDRAVANLGCKYLRALESVLTAAGQESINMRRDKDVVPLPVSQLKLRWVMRIVDGANTPARNEGNKKDAMQLSPLLLQLAQIAASPQVPPETQVAVRRIWDDVVKRFGMSEELSWDEISEGAQKLAQNAATEEEIPMPQGVQQEAAPEAAPPPPPPLHMTAEQEDATMSDEAAEADLRAAMQEG